MNVFAQPQLSAVTRLLTEAELPSSDLATVHLENFFGCGSTSAPDGIVGVELYESVALLRSLAVSVSCRSQGCGTELVAQAERFAESQGAKDIYLLTTTAERFFRTVGLCARTARGRAVCDPAHTRILNVMPFKLDLDGQAIASQPYRREGRAPFTVKIRPRNSGMAHTYLFFKPAHLPLTTADLNASTVLNLGDSPKVRTSLEQVFPGIAWQSPSFGQATLAGNWYELHLAESTEATLAIRCSLRADHITFVQSICDRLGWLSFDEQPRCFQPNREPMPA